MCIHVYMCVLYICIISPKLKPPHTHTHSTHAHSQRSYIVNYVYDVVWLVVARRRWRSCVVCVRGCFKHFTYAQIKELRERVHMQRTHTHTHIQRIVIIIIYVSPSLRARMWTNTHIKYIFASVYKLIRIIFVYVCVNNNIILKCLRTYKIAHI